VKPSTHVERIYNTLKTLASMNRNTLQGKIVIPFAHSSCLLQDISAGRIARQLWWKSQGFSSVDIIPPWFPLLCLKRTPCWLAICVRSVYPRDSTPIYGPHCCPTMGSRITDDIGHCCTTFLHISGLGSH
jgi:hypothetical protein